MDLIVKSAGVLLEKFSVKMDLYTFVYYITLFVAPLIGYLLLVKRQSSSGRNKQIKRVNYYMFFFQTGIILLNITLQNGNYAQKKTKLLKQITNTIL